jgi:hypothetical protein
MAESANQHLARLRKIEGDLRRRVEQVGAEFRASLNGNREGAAREFEKALRIFTDFIIKHKLPKS